MAASCRVQGVRLDGGYRVDILMEDILILELKCVEQIGKIHAAQLLTCMELAGTGTGLLINFNVRRLRDGSKGSFYNFFVPFVSSCSSW